MVCLDFFKYMIIKYMCNKDSIYDPFYVTFMVRQDSGVPI